MHEDRTAAVSNLDDEAQRREWSAPRLERLDVDEVTMGTPVAKNPSTLENMTSYNSPPVC